MNEIKTKPNLDCVLIATDKQKKEAQKLYEDYIIAREYDSAGMYFFNWADFDSMKFFVQNYKFSLRVAYDDYKYTGDILELDCNKTVAELAKEGKSLYIEIFDNEGPVDEDRLSLICAMVGEGIVIDGGDDIVLDVMERELTANDVIAFLQRRGLEYQKVINGYDEDDFIMHNFLSKVNDNHLWAYPNPDLTPTEEQMWAIVKKKHNNNLPIYKNYLNLDMIEFYLSNHKPAGFNKDFQIEFHQELKTRALIMKEKENIERVVPTQNAVQANKPSIKL